MRKLLALFLLGAALASARPNVVVIVGDRVGCNEFGSYGGSSATPRIDQLARDGLKFTDFYAGSPNRFVSLCCLMTGLDSGNAPVRGNFSAARGPTTRMAVSIYLTLGEALAKQGYATACAGIWGICDYKTFAVPWRKGFPTFAGFVEQADHYDEVSDQLYVGPRRVSAPTSANDLFMRTAFDFLEQNAHRPFFLYLPLTAGVGQLDDDVGRICDRLRGLGVDRNTLVLFTSSTGGGSDLRESGIRVPCIAFWPGHIAPGQTCSTPLGNWDFLATISEVGGAPAPAPTSGRSFASVFEGRAPLGHLYLYWECTDGGQASIAVRMGKWKALCPGADKPFELYDLEADPGETHNVASKHGDLIKRAIIIATRVRTDNRDYPLPTMKALRPPSARSTNRPSFLF